LSTIGEPLREMVSALVDGESSEFECRRVLDGMESPELRALLARHYSLRAIARRDGRQLCPAPVTEAILAALEAEATPVRGARRVPAWIGGAAVAASVCLVAVMGSRSLQTADGGGEAANLAAVGSLGTLGSPAVRPVVASSGAVQVGFGPAAPVSADRAAEQRLRMFMVEHAEDAALNAPQGMMPFARVVSYSPAEEP